MANTLYRALRKAILGKPLEDDEQGIFEAWQASPDKEDSIFERGEVVHTFEESKGKIEKAVEAVQSKEQLGTFLEKLFAPKAPAGTDNPRIKLPVYQFDEDDEDNQPNIETSTGRVGAHFELRELDDLIPSHDPLSQFAKRKDYPEGVQERPYHSDGGEQEKVRRNAANLNPRYLTTDNPDAMSGPPIIASNGIVLGGNSRTMSLQLAYAAYPDKAAKYKQNLTKRAPLFGFTKRQVESMEKPVLVRVVNKKLDMDEMAQASRRFNESSTQALQLDAEGVSKSKLVTKGTLGILRENLQEFDSLREYLSSPQSKTLVDALVEDGVIEKVQLSRVTNNEGLLNAEGKVLVEATLRGLIVQDYDLIRKTPASVVAKIDRAIPALAQLKGRGEDWDISGVITKALKQLQKALGSGLELKDVSAYFGTVPLIPDPERSNKGIQAMALTLANATPKELAARCSAIAAESTKVPEGMSMLMPADAPTAEKAFAKAFLRPVATVGSTVISNFQPEKNEKHAILQQAAQATRGHTAEGAVEKLSKDMVALTTSPEDKEKIQEAVRVLSSYSGAITIYQPKLGEFFSFSRSKGDTLLKK